MNVLLANNTQTTSGGKIVGTSDFLGAIFFLDVSARSGTTPTLDVKLQHVDGISGNFVDIPGASFTQKTAVGSDTLVVFPGLVELANRKVSSALGDQVRIVWTVGGTTPSFTFSLYMDELRSR